MIMLYTCIEVMSQNRYDASMDIMPFPKQTSTSVMGVWSHLFLDSNQSSKKWSTSMDSSTLCNRDSLLSSVNHSLFPAQVCPHCHNIQIIWLVNLTGTTHPLSMRISAIASLGLDNYDDIPFASSSLMTDHIFHLNPSFSVYGSLDQPSYQALDAAAAHPLCHLCSLYVPDNWCNMLHRKIHTARTVSHQW